MTTALSLSSCAKVFINPRLYVNHGTYMLSAENAAVVNSS